MNLKCKINGKEYPIVQGNTFSDEFNETLDSGSIIISQVDRIEDIRPYDDVYIYDNEFNGYENVLIKKDYKNAFKIIEEQENDFYFYIEIPDEFMQTLYKESMLKYSTRIILSQVEDDGNLISDYFDCYFEKIIDRYYLSIPDLKLNDDDVEFKEELVKSPDNENVWVLSKYSIHTTKYEICNTQYFTVEYFVQNFSHENKFFKHLLVQNINRKVLRLEDKDVYQYVILLMSETKGLEVIQLPNFSITQPLEIKLKKSVFDYMVDLIEMYSPIYKVVDNKEVQTWKYERKYNIDPKLKNIFGDIFSPDFTLNNPNLRDVLSQLMIVKDMIPYVENDVIKAMDISKRRGKFDIKGINFIESSLTSDNYCSSLKRTYNDALSEQKSCRMTEYLSFRNSNSALLTLENMRLETTYPIYKINKLYMCYYKKIKIATVEQEETVEKAFLCKQDISKLVKLNSERNVLSEDWSKFNSLNINNVDDLAKFKIGTIGYDIGSKFIDGWGTKYTSYLLFNWFPQANTYIQKIFEFMNTFYRFGIYNYSYLQEKCELKNNQSLDVIQDVKEGLVSPFFNEYPAGLKGLFFEIEYEPFYNGTIYHSKDNLDRDDIVINDNSSSSLTLLEQDGIALKEKINRFGNEIFQFNARYKDINEIQELGSVYDSEDGKNTDIIIYSREISIQDNVINCRYIGAKDYVLKNYFTSVYAKHRPYSLMSYGESVYRGENKKNYLLLDLEKKYIENNKNSLLYRNFEGINVEEDDTKYNSIPKIFSFIKDTIINQKEEFINYDKINYGYFNFKGSKYSSDVNVFNSADSLCFNIKMYDNVGAGVYVDVNNLEPFENLKDFIEVEDDVKGSLQEWYLTVDNEKSGFIEKMGFYVGHIDEKNLIPDGVVSNIDKITNKGLRKVSTFKSEQLENGNVVTLVEKVDVNVLDNDAIYKNIFELPKVDIEDENVKNLIGNEFLVKKDNKELIDMTFQLEPIAKSDKIIFSPWMMRLSDLNGNYLKLFQNKQVSNSVEFSTIFNVVPFQNISTTIYDVRNSLNPDYFPLMIMAIPTENLNIEDGKEVDTLEQVLLENNYVDIQTNFSFENEIRSEDPKMFENKVYSLNFHGKKIKSYNKQSIFVEGIQHVKWRKSGLFDASIFGKDRENIAEVLLEFKKVNKVWGLTPPSGVSWFVFDTHEQNINISNKVDEDSKIQYLCNNNKVLEVYTNSDLENNPRQINSQNSVINDTSFYTSPKLTYRQNMFVTTSNEPMKKHHVYNQYKYLEEIGLSEDNTGPLVSDVFYFEDDDKLVVDLNNFEHKKDEVKSVQLWYKDEGGALNFVFGVNVDESDFEKGSLEIHISLITHKDMRVFDNMHNVIGEVKNVANSEDVDDLTKQKYEKYIEK